MPSAKIAQIQPKPKARSRQRSPDDPQTDAPSLQSRLRCPAGRRGGRTSIAEEPALPFIAHPLNDGIDLLPAGFGDMIAEDDVPPTSSQRWSLTRQPIQWRTANLRAAVHRWNHTSRRRYPRNADGCTSRHPRHPSGHSRTCRSQPASYCC